MRGIKRKGLLVAKVVEVLALGWVLAAWKACVLLLPFQHTTLEPMTEVVGRDLVALGAHRELAPVRGVLIVLLRGCLHYLVIYFLEGLDSLCLIVQHRMVVFVRWSLILLVVNVVSVF